MSILSQLNSPVIYLICGCIVLFVALVCVVFAVRAYRAGKAIGMDVTKMKRTIVASATFAVLPSVGILLGVIALSGSLGTPWPWLRLSVIGALHYETQVAEAAAEAVGLPGLSATHMTAEAFTTIALLMSVCIMWGMVFCLFSLKAYTGRLNRPAGTKDSAGKKKSSLSQPISAAIWGSSPRPRGCSPSGEPGCLWRWPWSARLPCGSFCRSGIAVRPPGWTAFPLPAVCSLP